MVIDADAFRLHFETDLADEVLESYITDATEAIDARVGSNNSDQEIVLTARGSDQYIFLPRAVQDSGDISSITERFGNDQVTLDEDQWRLIGKRQIERIIGGGNLSPEIWGYDFVDHDVEFQILIEYSPKPDNDRRDRVTVDLVKLAIQYQGFQTERAGDYGSTMPDYQEERKKLIDELVPKLAFA